MPEVRTQHIVHEGQRLAVRLHGNTGRAALLVPAMGVPAAYYDRFAGQLSAAGFCVTVPDLRGTGDSTPGISRESRFGYADLVDDLGVVLTATGAEAPLLIGHSLGGHLAALHLALGGDGVGLVLVASGTP